MASITIRNLDENVKKRLRRQAAEHGRSLEAEVREILRQTTSVPKPVSGTGLDLFKEIRAFVDQYGGVDLETFPRTTMRAVELNDEPAVFRDNAPAAKKSKRTSLRRK